MDCFSTKGLLRGMLCVPMTGYDIQLMPEYRREQLDRI